MLDHRPRSPRKSLETRTPRLPAPRTATRPGARPAGPRLSLTLDNTLSTQAYAWSVVGEDHLLMRVRYLVPYDELAWAYAEHLPQWAKDRIFIPLKVVEPTVNLVGYLRTRWWEPGAVADFSSPAVVEQAAGPQLVTPWQHDWLVR